MKTIEQKLKYWKGDLTTQKSDSDAIFYIEQFISDLEELQKEDTVDFSDVQKKSLEMADQYMQYIAPEEHEALLKKYSTKETKTTDSLQTGECETKTPEIQDGSYWNANMKQQSNNTPLQDEEIEKAGNIALQEVDYHNFPRDLFEAGVKWVIAALSAPKEDTNKQEAEKLFPIMSFQEYLLNPPHDIFYTEYKARQECKREGYKAKEDTVQPTTPLLDIQLNRLWMKVREDWAYSDFKNAYLDIISQPVEKNAVQPIEKELKWVKTSERLPEKVGERYHIKVGQFNIDSMAGLMWKDKKKRTKQFYKVGIADWNLYPIENVNEWLEESQTKTEDSEQTCNCLFGNPNIAGAADNCPIHKDSEQTKPVEEIIKELENLSDVLNIYSYSTEDGLLNDYAQRLKSITDKLKSQPSAPVESAGGFYYPLFKYFSDEYNLTLVDGEIQDIIRQVEKFNDAQNNTL